MRFPAGPGREDDDEYQYTVELVLAKREARVARKGIVVQYAVKWDEWDQTPDMTWEPPENLSSAKEEVVKFERRTSQCFVCAKMVHPACATQHLFLEPFIQKLDSANICFDCALLVAMVEKRTPFGIAGARLMFEPYYLQLRGVAALTEPSPFALGAFIATGSLKLLEAATTTA
uniref:Chromo domain-containing protein n=2 Tax=Emiliania huxleyi TaxID=2903 RepID=A0A0D3IAK9_EMIH1